MKRFIQLCCLALIPCALWAATDDRILPDELPEELDFSQVLRTWRSEESEPLTPWAGEATKIAIGLYERRLTLNEQREALKNLKAKAAEISAKLPRGASASIRDKYQSLRGNIERRAEVLDAAISAIVDIRQRFTGTTAEEAEKKVKQLVVTLEHLETKSLRETAETGRRLLGELARLLSPDYPFVLTVQQNYFNFNFHVIVSKKLFDQMAQPPVVKVGTINETILNAHVTGTQSNVTRNQLEFVENFTQAQMRISISGEVNSTTTAVPHKAPSVSVHGSGTTWFGGYSDVFYDGRQFSYSTPVLGVSAQNHTDAIEARGLFRGYKLRAAERESNQMRPQTEAIAAQKVYAQAYPEFVSKLSSGLGETNTNLKTNLFGPLRNAGMLPDIYRYWTTRTHLLGVSVVGRGDEVAGNRWQRDLGENDLLIAAHESVFNNSFDRVGLAGKKLTGEQTSKEIENFLKKVFPAHNFEEKKDPKKKVSPTVFVYDPKDPIRASIQDGAINLHLRVGIETPGKAPIGITEVKVPFLITLNQDKVEFDYGQIVASKVDGGKLGAELGVVVEQIEKTLPEKSEGKRRIAMGKPENGIVSSAYIDSLELADGSLVLRLRNFKKVAVKEAGTLTPGK